MSDNMAGSGFEVFWLRLGLDLPIISDLRIGGFQPSQVLAIPAAIIKTNRSPGQLISEVFAKSLEQAGEKIEIQFKKETAINIDSSYHYSWIRTNLPLPEEIPENQELVPQFDIIFALDLFFKDFKYVQDFDELEPGTIGYEELQKTKHRVTDILKRFSYHARETIVGSPLVLYPDLKRNPETGVLYSDQKGPQQAHEWLEGLVSEMAEASQEISGRGKGRIEVVDLRNTTLMIYQNEAIVFDLNGSRYQVSKRELFSADNRHLSRNGCKILANMIMASISERNPDWRNYMTPIPFEALRLGDSAGMTPLNGYHAVVEADSVKPREKSITSEAFRQVDFSLSTGDR
jgi:hypothetical protein